MTRPAAPRAGKLTARMKGTHEGHGGAMTVIVNGAPTALAAEATVASLLVRLGHPPAGAGIAVAVNGEVVPRAAWATTRLREADRVEVLGAVQGG